MLAVLPVSRSAGVVQCTSCLLSFPLCAGKSANLSFRASSPCVRLSSGRNLISSHLEFFVYKWTIDPFDRRTLTTTTTTLHFAYPPVCAGRITKYHLPRPYPINTPARPAKLQHCVCWPNLFPREWFDVSTKLTFLEFPLRLLLGEINHVIMLQS